MSIVLDGALLIVGFVWLVVGLTLGIGFGLRAAGSPVPATIATVIGGVALTAADRFSCAGCARSC